MIVGTASGFIAFLFVATGVFLLWSVSLMLVGPDMTRLMVAVAGLSFVSWLATSIKNA